MRYKCVKSFSLPMLDEYENETGEYVTTPEGSIWERNEIAYLSDVRLDKKDSSWVEDGSWIEITNETLAKHFVEVSDE